MRASVSLIVTIVAVLLAGCHTMGPRSGPPPGASKKPCRDADCDLRVTVRDCVITLEADVIEVIDATPSARTNRKLQWNLDTDGYKFSNDRVNYGIVIKDFDPTREFDNPMRQDRKFTLQFRNSFRKPDGYAYAVNVVKDDGTVCATLDPWVVN